MIQRIINPDRTDTNHLILYSGMYVQFLPRQAFVNAEINLLKKFMQSFWGRRYVVIDESAYFSRPFGS